MNTTRIAASSTESWRSKDRLNPCMDDKMAELTVVLIRKSDPMDHKSWSFV